MTGRAKTEPIAVRHHGRTVFGDIRLPDADDFPTVLFCHGFNGWKEDFKELAEAFLRSGVGSVTFTFCGSGPRDLSGFPTTDMTLETERDDLIALLGEVKRFGCKGMVYLFGASQGGTVCALAAQARAAEIDGMILLYPAFCICDDWNRRFPKAVYPTDDALPEFVKDFNHWGVDLGRQFIRSAREADVFPGMSDFRGPVLIFHGDNDAVVDVRYSKRATGKGGYPNSALVEYADFAHGAQPSALDFETKLLPLVKMGILPPL